MILGTIAIAAVLVALVSLLYRMAQQVTTRPATLDMIDEPPTDPTVEKAPSGVRSGLAVAPAPSENVERPAENAETKSATVTGAAPRPSASARVAPPSSDAPSAPSKAPNRDIFRRPTF
ncbi:MAG TPA: hypothetical protein VGL13_03555 [Polyangiaceae bacterium]|jgi:hypothetical protein